MQHIVIKHSDKSLGKLYFTEVLEKKKAQL